jgi:hypothetical protein
VLSERLALLVSLDAKGAISGFEKVGKSADRNLSKATQQTDRMGQAFQKVGVGMAATGGLLAVGLFKAAQASEEANLAVVKLENSLKNNPRLVGETSDAFIELADSIQDKTAADGDAIVAGQAMLATFRVTGDQIRELTPLVVDYARKFGTDLVSANAAVGKALDGSVGALKRNGVSIDETLFKTDRYAAVQKALAEQVGGFAEAEGKTFAGSLERLNNQLGDLVEGVGTGAVDAFSSMIGAAEPLIDKMNELDPAVSGTVGKVATFGSAGLIAAGGLSFVVGKAIELRNSIKDLPSRVGQLTGGLRGLAKVAGVAAAGFALFELNEYRKSLQDAEVDVDALAAALGTLSGASEAQLREMVETTAALGELDQVVSDTADTNIAAATRLVDYAEANGVAADEVAHLRDIVADKKAVDVQAAADQNANSDAIAGAIGPTGELADETEGLTTELDELSTALKAQFDPLFGAQDAALKLAEAQAAATEAVKEHGAGSAEAVLANRELTAAALEYESSLIELQSAVVAGDVSQEEYTATLNRWVTQGHITRTAADQAAAAFGTLTSKAEAVPDSVTTTVVTPGLIAAIMNVNNLIDRLGVMQGTYAANSGLGAFYGGSYDGLATGGPAMAGQTYIVGERGPELLTMGRSSGYVTPNNQIGTAGGSQTIVIQVGDRVIDELVVDSLGRVESRNGAVRVRTRAA